MPDGSRGIRPSSGRCRSDVLNDAVLVQVEGKALPDLRIQKNLVPNRVRGNGKKIHPLPRVIDGPIAEAGRKDNMLGLAETFQDMGFPMEETVDRRDQWLYSLKFWSTVRRKESEGILAPGEAAIVQAALGGDIFV